MPDSFRLTFRHSAIAVLAIFLATVARLALIPVLGELLPFATLFLGLLVAAAFAGRGPGLVATAMGGMAAAFLLNPRGESAFRSVAYQAGLALYLSVGMGIAFLGGSMRSSVQRAEAIEQRELPRITLASIGDAVIVTDDRGQIRFFNPVAEVMSGWRSDEAAGRPITEVFPMTHEVTRGPADEPVARVIRDGVVAGVTSRSLLIARDGTETPIEERTGPVKDRSGKLVGVVMVFQNATERRRHESAMHDGAERFRQMAWMAEPDGSISWYNQRWYDSTGTDHEAMQG